MGNESGRNGAADLPGVRASVNNSGLQSPNGVTFDSPARGLPKGWVGDLKKHAAPSGRDAFRAKALRPDGAWVFPAPLTQGYAKTLRPGLSNHATFGAERQTISCPPITEYTFPARLSFRQRMLFELAEESAPRQTKQAGGTGLVPLGLLQGTEQFATFLVSGE